MLEVSINAASRVIEAIAAVMIVASTVMGVFEVARAAMARDLDGRVTTARLRLAGRLVLSLEFLIAADILKTVTTPTLEGMGLLAGVIVIRTVLSLSIAFELRKATTASQPASVIPATEPSP